MRLSHFLSAAAMLSLAAAPAIAGTGNRASALSLKSDVKRATAPMKGASRARGTGLIIAGVTAAVLVVGLVALKNKDNTPASP